MKNLVTSCLISLVFSLSACNKAGELINGRTNSGSDETAQLTIKPSNKRGRDKRYRYKTISGKVSAGGTRWRGAKVTLYQAGKKEAKELGAAVTDDKGRYAIKVRQVDRGDLLYLVASGKNYGSTNPVILMSPAGEVGKKLQRKVEINELTTVASAFALSQFLDGTKVSGSSLGLNNAMAATFNLVNPRNGEPGKVISNFNNGSTLEENKRSSLARLTQNTMANMLAACAAEQNQCEKLFTLTTVNDDPPSNTLEAAHNLARNPSGLDNAALLALAKSEPLYQPGLNIVDERWAWIIALHYTEGGFNAPGRMAFDAEGNVWSNNNFMPPAGSPVNIPGKQVTVLNPQGDPILGSPIFSRFVSGSGYGTAVDADGNAWIANFDDGGITKFSSQGNVLLHASADKTGTNHPMGMAFDQDGNLWIPNMGDPSEILDNGSVTVFIKGNPKRRATYTHTPEGPTIGLVRKPFSIAIDGKGRAWVANGAGPAPGGSVTVLRLNRRNEIEFVKQINSEGLSAPIVEDELRPFGLIVTSRTVATDSKGNAWVSSFEDNIVTFIDGETFEAQDFRVDPLTRGWGMAVDGNDRVWEVSFTNPLVSGLLQEPPVVNVLQGTGDNKGFLYSFSNPCLQHLTALQIDASGNVWVANNWALETTPVPLNIIGGDGLVQFVGLAKPVVTPLIGPPQTP